MLKTLTDHFVQIEYNAKSANNFFLYAMYIWRFIRVTENSEAQFT